MFVQRCHCDASKQHLRHVTKCRACHEIEKTQQSAAPATKKLHVFIDTLPKYYAPATQNANAIATHVTKCDKTRYLRENMRKSTSSTASGSHFVSAAQRWGLARLRSWKQSWANTTPTSQLNENPSLRIHSGKMLKGACPLIISRKIYFKQHGECFGYRNSSSLSSWWMHKLHLAIIAQEGGEALTEWCLESASRRWLICLMLTWKTACPREPPNTAVWAEQCHGSH